MIDLTAIKKRYPFNETEDLWQVIALAEQLQAENAAMFMWATYPRLDFGIQLLEAWGFKYRTVAFTWVKTGKTSQPIYGPGYYTASNPEIVLIGVKGSMQPKKKMTPSVIITPRMEHSRKPDIHGAIRAMYPNGLALEMFARRPMDGWASYGNQLNEGSNESH